MEECFYFPLFSVLAVPSNGHFNFAEQDIPALFLHNFFFYWTKFINCTIFNNMNVINRLTKKIRYEDQFFKVLGHPARLAILDELRKGEACVCHLEAKLGYRQAYLSQQISVLREAGLIQDRREGWNVFYRVTDERIYQVLHLVRQMLNKQENEVVLTERPCTCPKCIAQSDGHKN